MSKDNKDLVVETKDEKETNDVMPLSAPQALAAEGDGELANAFSTHGTLLEYSEDGTTWIKISNLKTVTPPSVSADEVETTDHDSKGWKEFIAGLKDGGSMPFTVNIREEDNITKMFELANSGKTVHWRITVPTKPKFIVTLKGFVKSFNIDELPATPGAATASGEIRNSGVPKYNFESGE